MTGTSIVVSRSELDTLQELGNLLLTSGYFNDVEKIAQAAVKVLAGRELGLGPVASMRSLHIVDGKVQLSADLLAQRVKQHPRYDYRVERLDAEACVIRFFEDGEPCGVSEFTMGDASNANLLGKKSQTWERYPRNLLWARAMSNGVGWFAPDVAAGGSFIVEGGVTVDTATGEIIEVPAELEPGDGSADRSSLVGMGEVGGSSADVGNTGADVDDPARGESEGPSEDQVVAETGRTLGEGAEGSPDTSDSPAPQGTEGEGLGGQPAESGARPAGSSLAGGSAEPLKSSQRQQLLRHAVALRWDDSDIAAAVEEAYPGITEISGLSQEQARALIPEWSKLVKATRIRPEQKDKLKPLASPTDAVRRAQVLFGANFIRNLSDLNITEAEALISDLEQVRAEQVSA